MERRTNWNREEVGLDSESREEPVDRGQWRQNGRDIKSKRHSTGGTKGQVTGEGRQVAEPQG